MDDETAPSRATVQGAVAFATSTLVTHFTDQ